MRNNIFIAIFIVLFATAMITVVAEANPSRLQPDVRLSMTPEGEIVISAGAMNTGRATYPGTNTLDAWLTITEKDTGLVATRSSFNYLPALGASNAAFPFHMKVKIKPGTYTLTIVSERMQTFSIDIFLEEVNTHCILYAPIDKLTASDEFNLAIEQRP